tara:strand:+ start:207 stop:434 length:228 start_codon:yes stop_codon:yes gene_type:complete
LWSKANFELEFEFEFAFDFAFDTPRERKNSFGLETREEEKWAPGSFRMFLAELDDVRSWRVRNRVFDVISDSDSN